MGLGQAVEPLVHRSFCSATLRLLLFAGWPTLCPSSYAQSILTIAGGGTDDGRPATVASLSPGGIAADVSGNLYIADYGNHRIRKVTATNGVIRSVVGTGTAGFGGDGGPATAAFLLLPSSVVVHPAGNLYIADSQNHRIRKVTVADGLISTVAGNGNEGSSGDGGPATGASLNRPTDLALDSSGNLYIAEIGGHRIRKVDAASGIISTVAGTGSEGYSGDGGPATAASLSSPGGVEVDRLGNIWIADGLNYRIRKVDGATSIITTVAGTGAGGLSGDGVPATEASLAIPTDVIVDDSGNLFIADWNNHRVRKVSAGIITTIAGNGIPGFSGDGGPATAASFYGPTNLALDTSGDLYVVDAVNRRIRKVSGGIVTTIAGSEGFSGDGGPATAAFLSSPRDVAVDRQGNIYIADTGFLDHHKVRKLTAATGVITTVAGRGKFGFSGDGGPATEALLAGPSGIAVDSAGNLYIADTSNYRIRKVAAESGIITTIAGRETQGSSGDGGPATAASFVWPNSIALDDLGNLFISDELANRIRKIASATGTITTVAGNGVEGFTGDGGPATQAALNRPSDVAVDASGNLYIADYGNHRIRKVTATSGIISTVAGTGSRGFSGDGGPATAASLNLPEAVELDSSVNLYIADYANHRIRGVSATTGIITTVAGNGSRGSSGDGGPATAASLSSPHGVTLEGTGNLYIADTDNARIRAVFACLGVATPELTSPAERSAGVSTSPRLAWNPARGAFRYDVYFDVVNPPKQIVAADIATTTFAPSNLEPLTMYYWQVVAKGDSFCVPFSTAASEIRSFTTAGACSPPGSFQ